MPEETTRLNRSARSLCSIAENAEPEWLTNAIGPGRRSSGSRKPHARRPPSTFTNPIPLPPHTDMPASRAIAASRSGSGVTPGRGAS